MRSRGDASSGIGLSQHEVERGGHQRIAQAGDFKGDFTQRNAQMQVAQGDAQVFAVAETAKAGFHIGAERVIGDRRLRERAVFVGQSRLVQ